VLEMQSLNKFFLKEKRLLPSFKSCLSERLYKPMHIKCRLDSLIQQEGPILSVLTQGSVCVCVCWYSEKSERIAVHLQLVPVVDTSS
jgi:hypothetical protein